MRRLTTKSVEKAWALAWTVLAPVIRPPCPVCRGRTTPRWAYRRSFLQCRVCRFIFSHDYPEFAALSGMGMTGSWGGTSSGGEREDYLTRMLVAEFAVSKVLLYGVGSALAFPVLLDEGYDVEGTDVTEEVIAFRKKAAGDRFFHASDLSQRRAVYDAVIACEVFEHFHQPRRWIGEIAASLKPGGVLCGTTNFHPGGRIEDGQKVGYMSLRGHVAYWSETSFSRAVDAHGMKAVFFEMVCPGSVKRDLKYDDLFPNKRVFFATSDEKRMHQLTELRRSTPVLPIDLSDYSVAAYRVPSHASQATRDRSDREPCE